MKVMIISGSHRQHSQSMKVAQFIKNTLLEQQECEQVDILDLACRFADAPIPLWDEGIWRGEAQWLDILQPISTALDESDAFVIISPEYHGQVPSALRNFFLMWGKGEVAHKPAMLVGVSSGDGGATPIAELRMSSYKNNRICYIPEQIIIRNVESVLNEADSDNNSETDQYFRNRITFSLAILKEYALALQQVRASGITFHEDYKNGM